MYTCVIVSLCSHLYVCVCACRLATGDPALSDLVRRSGELALWLEQAEYAVSSLPVTATDKNLKELKVQPGTQHFHISVTQLMFHGIIARSISAPVLPDGAIFYGQR